MTEQNQKQLGAVLWSIADTLRGAMDADDFRDYMLAFLFGAVLVKTNVLLVLPNKLAELGAVYDCLH